MSENTYTYAKLTCEIVDCEGLAAAQDEASTRPVQTLSLGVMGKGMPEKLAALYIAILDVDYMEPDVSGLAAGTAAGVLADHLFELERAWDLTDAAAWVFNLGICDIDCEQRVLSIIQAAREARIRCAREALAEAAAFASAA